MLLKLPLDLLIDIAQYLHISEKLELILTCKKIKDALFERCLYETIELPDEDGENSESIVLKFRKNRTHGQRVKVLRLDFADFSHQLYSEIPLIFPNVIDFYDTTIGSQTRPEEAHSEYIRWKDTLEYLNGQTNNKPGIVFQLLEKNVFSCLTHLMIPLLKVNGRSARFTEYIKNAPALQSLTLERYPVSLSDMETIHSSCPQLTSLKLSSCIILVSEEDNDLFLTEITPALRLSHLVVSTCLLCDQQCLFLNYITRKYTNLTKFKFYPTTNGNLLGPLFLDQSPAELANNPDYIARKNESVATYESYVISASKILSNLPSTLKIMEFTTFSINDPMTIFSKKCVNLIKISFFDDLHVNGASLSSPEDITKLKSLPFLRHLSISLDPSIQKHQVTPGSTSVTQLDVVIKGTTVWNDMDVGCILSMFPSVKNLTLHHSGARLIGYENDPPKTYPHLTQLSIGPSDLHPNLLKFFGRVAPNLKELEYNIFGKRIKESLEKRHMDRSVIIQPEYSKITDHQIDLTGLVLDCFYLKVDLTEKYVGQHDDIMLILKKKNRITKEFVISECFRSISLAECTCKSIRERIKTKVTLNYDCTKRFTVNSRISIDLNKSQLQLNLY